MAPSTMLSQSGGCMAGSSSARLVPTRAARSARRFGRWAGLLLGAPWLFLGCRDRLQLPPAGAAEVENHGAGGARASPAVAESGTEQSAGAEAATAAAGESSRPQASGSTEP